MSNDTLISLAAPRRVSDPLTELLRTGARRRMEAAVPRVVEGLPEALSRSPKNTQGMVESRSPVA